MKENENERKNENGNEKQKRNASKRKATQIKNRNDSNKKSLAIKAGSRIPSCSTRRLARGAPCQTEGRGHTKDHFLPRRGGAAPNQAAQSDRSRARMPDSRRTLLLRTHASSACLQPKRRASNCASADARVAASFAVSRASTRQESAPWS
jgi:hypothetical protein